ncbi:hypothetical protein KALB_4212 [Kutzneria albida DSM 43870]|uniref:Uncharacterized protein n=1 Tax=Kutzneria albida DSM 43870 TaxID=1449976 RepID=W5W9Y9_9PSEU|nr:hypothetical protein KALB_4212 [Kutzneria albida DSM 43870]
MRGRWWRASSTATDAGSPGGTCRRCSGRGRRSGAWHCRLSATGTWDMVLTRLLAAAGVAVTGAAGGGADQHHAVTHTHRRDLVVEPPTGHGRPVPVGATQQTQVTQGSTVITAGDCRQWVPRWGRLRAASPQQSSPRPRRATAATGGSGGPRVVRRVARAPRDHRGTRSRGGSSTDDGAGDGEQPSGPPVGAVHLGRRARPPPRPCPRAIRPGASTCCRCPRRCPGRCPRRRCAR